MMYRGVCAMYRLAFISEFEVACQMCVREREREREEEEGGGGGERIQQCLVQANYSTDYRKGTQPGYPYDDKNIIIIIVTIIIFADSAVYMYLSQNS